VWVFLSKIWGLLETAVNDAKLEEK